MWSGFGEKFRIQLRIRKPDLCSEVGTGTYHIFADINLLAYALWTYQKFVLFLRIFQIKNCLCEVKIFAYVPRSWAGRVRPWAGCGMRRRGACWSACPRPATKLVRPIFPSCLRIRLSTGSLYPSHTCVLRSLKAGLRSRAIFPRLRLRSRLFFFTAPAPTHIASHQFLKINAYGTLFFFSLNCFMHGSPGAPSGQKYVVFWFFPHSFT